MHKKAAASPRLFYNSLIICGGISAGVLGIYSHVALKAVYGVAHTSCGVARGSVKRHIGVAVCVAHAAVRAAVIGVYLTVIVRIVAGRGVGFI